MFISKSFSFNRHAWSPASTVAPCGAGASLAGAKALFRRLVGVLGKNSAAGAGLEHLATLPIAAQPSLVLVRLGQETLLLGATAKQVSLLAKLPADVTEPATLAEQDSVEKEGVRQ